MSNHDPLCPWSGMAGHGVTPPPLNDCIYCPMIRTARFEERSLLYGGKGWIAQEDVVAWLTDLRAEVRDMGCIEDTSDHMECSVYRSEVLDLIDEAMKK